MKNITVKVTAIFLSIVLASSFIVGCRKDNTVTSTVESATDVSSADVSSADDSSSGESSDSSLSVASDVSSDDSQVQSAASSQIISSSSQNSVVSNAPAVVDKPTFSPEKKENLGGYEMTIATMWADLWVPSKTSTSAAVREFNANLKKIETDYNCKIIIKPESPAKMLDNIVKAAAAGDKYADVIEIAPIFYYNLIVQKHLQPINDLPDLNFNDTGWVSVYKKMTTYNNKFYGIVYISKTSGAPLRTCMFFNKDLMATYKQPDIYNLVKTNKWDWAAFENIMKDVKSKSGNKVFGVSAYDYAAFGLDMISTNNATIYSESNGKFSYTANSANAIEAMEFTRKIMTDNLFNPFRAGDYLATSYKDFIDNKVLFYIHDYYLVDHLNTDMKKPYGVVPLPKGPKSNEVSSRYNEGKFLSFMAGNKDVGKAAKLMFAIAKRTNDPNWISTQVETVLRDKQSGEMLKYLIKNPVVDCSPLIPNFNLTIMGTITKIAKGEQTAKAGLANIQMAAQSNLNDFFKQK